MPKGKIFIGTSGWAYDHWVNVFYPEDLKQKNWLDFYKKHFDTVELNTSFYYLPKPETFSGWRKQVPKDFIFSVKASRFITHVKKLRNCQEPWQKFISAAKNLKENLGPILFQLPTFLKANLKVLEDFLKILSIRQAQGRPRKKYLYAFEPRHESWFCNDIYKILKKFNVALCIADSPSWPEVEVITSNFVYLRFHGGKILYGSEYSLKELKAWSKKIKKWQKKKLDVFVYFNNDAYGFAVKNAKQLEKLVK
jgi:uncharacterized protein YecE (DUF72 family)